MKTPISEEGALLQEEAFFVDLHCDLLLTTVLTGWQWDRLHRPNPLPGAPLMGHVDIPRLKAGGVNGLGLGVVTLPFMGKKAIEYQVDLFEKRLAKHDTDLGLARTAADMLHLQQSGKIACFLGLEGVHSLHGDWSTLPDLAKRGLLYTGLVHVTRNQAASPMVGWGANPDRRLTPLGRDLVETLHTNQILVDVAHLNRAGLFEICESSPLPIICSHTACNAVHGSPRGLDPDALKAIANTGGVIGVIFVSFFIGRGGIQQVVRHLEHIRNTAGIEACAIGTDWEGFALYPGDLDSAEKLPRLTQALLDAGWSISDIKKAYGENFLRVVKAVRGS
ncbi:MAG: membrane dipeptidase [Myxococcota bacterium]|nr:membrane dipeptidase [Myxococcota bacterium]